jgi:sigma-B regulation protein RsbU (phosphoserine phosphatase)
MRILIVDDEPVNRLVLTRKLSLWGHEVVPACDGAQAWEMIQTEPFRMVITDWMMPGMDGIELTRRIRRSPIGGYCYVLLLTARSGTPALVEGMEAGADDFVTKPFEVEELRARIRAGERVLQLESDLAEHNQRLEHAYAIAKRDLEAAAAMQKALLPSPRLSLAGLRTAWRFLPASYVAGDVFGLHPLDEDRTSFYVLDVAGHGVPSAMLSFTLSKVLAPPLAPDGLLKLSSTDSPLGVWAEPREVLRELNRRFQDDSDAMKYFTMIYGIIDTRAGRLTLAQAGHPSPLLAHAGGVRRLGDTGFPIGMLPGLEYDQVEAPFEPGDRLLLYSDGVTECANEQNEQYRVERLERWMTGQSEAPLEEAVTRLERDLRMWRGREDFADDVSFMAIERSAA